MKVSFFSLMFLLFLGLKLSGFVTWGWALVFAPLYIPILMTLLVLGVIVLAVYLLKLLEKSLEDAPKKAR